MSFKPVDLKINFPEMEKKLLKEWYESGLVQKYLHKNDSSKKNYSFLDGPITANNPMGVHHGWSRTYKDLWQRYHNMKGEKQRFQNGFDCQGLWVEVEVEKELGLKNKKDIENLIPGDKRASVSKFVQLCKDRVIKYSGVQTEQSKRLGYFMDWDHSYFTMSDENNYTIWHFLKVCDERGWIYKGHDVVPWCPRCETAISEHEILTEDYKEINHKTIYIKFPIEGKEKEYLLVWTTTPWTIPADVCVAVDEKLDYSQVKDESGNLYWLASESVERVFQGLTKEIVKKVKGKELVGLKYKGAYDGLEAVKKSSSNPIFHTVIPTDDMLMPISAVEGTGMVHTAPGTGQEDFRLGKKLGLPVLSAIDDEANYLEGFGELSKLNAKKHPEIILDNMEKQGFAFKIENYTHRYPACWRCKTELVWKVADEWYISMDRPSLKLRSGKSSEKTLREQLIDVTKTITWLPDFGLDRELDWLKNMHDWLISKKNRYWGLALPIYECKKCNNFEVIGSKEELKERAVSGWDQFEGNSPHKPFIDEVKIKCSKCGEEVSRINDVGNPWLDAGIVSFSTIAEKNQGEPLYFKDRKKWQEWFPANFITESFPGQFKNWFYSLIVMSTVLEGEKPFETVLGFASLLGEDGRPMHKSWGNSIEFNEGADKIGVDVMRWMYVTQNPTDNLLFGYHKADEVRRRFYLTLWNVYNFFITYANIDKWEKAKGHKEGKNILDKWIISRLNELTKTVTESLDKYDAQIASLATEKFVDDLSLWYVRRSRDRVGPAVEDKEEKQSFYETLYTVLVTLSKLLAPFTPFIAEEIYTNLTEEESVHLADWPEYKGSTVDELLEKEVEDARSIVVVGHAFRKSEGLKVRQPLSGMAYTRNKKLSEGVEKLIKEELNIKSLRWEKSEEINGKFSVEDLKITPELKEEGDAREIIRAIQGLRKEKGCKINEKIVVYAPYPKAFEGYIKRETLASKLVWQESLEISTG